MSKDLRLNSAHIHQSAGHVDVTADDLRARHASVHERIAEAQTGWIGSSAAALAARAAKWEEETASQYTEMVTRAEQFRSAAASYVDTDTDASADIVTVASKIGNMGL